MKRSLSGKITLSMVALAVSGILLTALLTHLTLNWNFRRYLRGVEEEQNRRIVATLAELYGEARSWMGIRQSTMYVGATTETQIRVFDLDGQLIADSLPGMRGMRGRRGQWPQPARGQAYEYPLFVNGQRVGTVEITHLGQYGLRTGEALVFHRTVRQSAFLTGLLVIAAAMLAGSLLARRLTSRLGGLSAAADSWGQGRFDSRVSVDGEDELAFLGVTMNRMAARLEEQSNLRRKLTGDISHELRTPLATIQSYLEAFLDGVLEPNEQNINAVLEESNRLARLVNDLQELVNAEFRGRHVNMAEVDLSGFAAAEAERVRPLLQQKNIHLTINRHHGPLPVLADESLLGRVIGNLLVNAYKYTPEGGQITVSLLEEGGRGGVSVADTGIGIDKEHLPYIFERFYRADPSRTRATGGSGIGLAIVKELVEAMDGVVDAQSEPGRGSTFKVLFPKAAK